MSRRYVLSIVLLVFLGASCVSSREGRPEDTGFAPTEVASRELARRLSVSVRDLAAQDRERFDLLLISGGGRNGAWGAGVLRGWREHPQHPRPHQFDIVTGVSTGALMASFAFLGERDVPLGPQGTLISTDEALRMAYTQTTSDDLLYPRFALGALLYGSAFNGAEPFVKLLERFLTDDVIDLVAEEGKSGRLFYVGTTNLDVGRFAIWDMVDLARRGEYELYRTVIRASAAVPLLFPPVEIEGFLHADGGVREQLFLRDVLIPFRDTLEAQHRGEARPELAIHVLVNGVIGAPPAVVQPSIPEMVERSLIILLDESLIEDLRDANAVCDSVDARFGLAYLPHADNPPGQVIDFDPEIMRELYQKGLAWGRSHRWVDKPPSVGAVGH
jgi:Patatin-like phospholipase